MLQTRLADTRIISYLKRTKRPRRALISQGAQHSTRAPLVRWFGTVNSEGPVLAVCQQHTEYHIKHLELHFVINRICDTKTQSGVFTCCQFNNTTLAVSHQMVSTWRMTRAVFVLGACHVSRACAHLYSDRGISHRTCCAPVLMGATTAMHQTAHVPSRAQEWALIARCVCSPHEMHSLCVVIVAARVKIVSPPTVARAEKQGQDPKSRKTLDGIRHVLYT